MQRLRLRALGPVTATVGDRPLDLGPNRQLALLSVLVCRLNTPVAAPALLTAVWGDEPPVSGGKVVATYVHRLRGLLAAAPEAAAPVIEHGRHGYTLRHDPGCVDVARFTGLVRAALADRAVGRPAAALAGARAALALWGGDPFGSLPGPALAAERARLHELRLSALATRLELELAAGGSAGLLAELHGLHVEHPLHERFTCLLMTALHRCGRPADALAAHARTARQLDHELGVPPGPELRDHRRAVLTRDPALDIPPDRALSAGPGMPLGSGVVKLREDEVRVPSPDGDIRAVLIAPVAGTGPRPGVLLYTDIFQVTESTLRTARRLASSGYTVCVPEIYPHGELAGVALEFDDAGKAAGMAGAKATTAAQFDADRVAVLDFLESRDDVGALAAVGFCIGGHLAFRAAFDPRVAATVCFYPTGLHDGALGADADAGSLARAGDIRGRLMVVFGSQDPHVPAPARAQILSALYSAGLEDLELHVYAGGEHAFMRDIGARHDPALTDLALAEAVSFLTAR